MRAAADKEDLSEKSAVSPGRLLPAREPLGDMLLAAGQAAQALAAYQASDKRDPKRFRTLWGEAQAEGNADQTRTYYAQLIELAGTGDPRPELTTARTWLAAH